MEGNLVVRVRHVDPQAATASVIAIERSAFPGSSPVLGFDGLTLGTEVNGLTVAGVRFSYAVGGMPLSGALQISSGPGTTNNISAPAIGSLGDNRGTLTISLPVPAYSVGYGFALLSGTAIPEATQISVFNGTALQGSSSFRATPDPTFAGGFAGLASTTAFDSVTVVFNSTAGSAFAVDHIVFADAPIPEPSTVALAAIGAVSLLCVRSRRVNWSGPGHQGISSWPAGCA